MFDGTRGRVRRGLPFAALMVAAGCATTGGAPGDQRERNVVVIEVQNDNFNQATVFLPDGLGRLGIVGGKSKATFRVDWPPSEIELHIRLLTGGSVRLRPHSGGTGETWRFIIPATCC